MEHAKRNAFTELCHAGRIPADLAKVLKYPWTTVYDVCKRYDRSRDFSRATNKPRRDRKLISSLFNGLKRSVNANPDANDDFGQEEGCQQEKYRKRPRQIEINIICSR